MTYSSRVTIDIDSYEDDWRMRAVRAYHELDHIAADVEVRISSSGEGLHLIGWFDDRLTDDEKTRLRHHLRDDQKRMELDELRGKVGHTTNVLWTRKAGGEADVDFTTVHDALDAIDGRRGWV